MIKPLGQFVFLRMLPGWILALVFVVITTPWLQQWHSALFAQSAHWQGIESLPIKYRVNPKLGNADELWVRWPGGVETRLSPYTDSRFNSDVYLSYYFITGRIGCFEGKTI